MTVVFSAWLAGTPVAKGRPRFSRRSGRTYTPAKTETAERVLRAQLLASAEELQSLPFHGALGVRAEFVLAVPASWPKKERAAALDGARLPTSRPDVDNFAKLVLDAANGVLWPDDSAVVELLVSKRYGAEPGVRLVVTHKEDSWLPT
jgi:Holliday junction resolvase RusA-like endonuclease